jgi:pimeloyl-ACP methyl ester carboxylesterase
MTDEKRVIGEIVLSGTSFHYDISGTGHPLVLVHSGVADRHMWDEQVEAFAQHYQVLRYDLRGYGQTASVAGSYAHRQDLYDLLRALGIEKAYMMGCSLGGATSIDFALEHPEMVDALLSIDCVPGGFQPTAAHSDEIMKLLQEHQGAIKRGDIEKASEIEADYWLTGPQRTIGRIDPVLLARSRAMNVIALKNKLANLGSEQPLEPPAVGRLDELHVPTLVITGSMDDPIVLEGCAWMVTHIAGARQAVIPNVGHHPNMEKPAEFNRLVLDFLASL